MVEVSLTSVSLLAVPTKVALNLSFKAKLRA